MLSLRASGHLVQLVPQPALPQVPDQRARAVAAQRVGKNCCRCPYFHVVFTLPHELSALALQNKKLLYDLLFRASAADAAGGRRRSRSTSAPRSASSACCTPGDRTSSTIRMSIASFRPAGSRLDSPRWIRATHAFFLPVRVLSRVFRGKFVAGLEAALPQRQARLSRLACSRWRTRSSSALSCDSYSGKDWVVYAKPPFGGPEHVLQYLARYTHRVAISNHRLDRASKTARYVPLEGLRPRRQEAEDDPHGRRVPAPVPPARAAAGFVRIRHFGFLANRKPRAPAAALPSTAR